MAPTLPLALLAFIACYALTPLVRSWSLRRGFVDQPDGRRKIHRTPIPRTGGVAIVVSCLLALALLFVWPNETAIPLDLPLLAGVLPAVFIIFAVGLIDDLVGVRPSRKLIVQILAACLAYSAGLRVTAFAGMAAPGWTSLPLTVAWLVGCANAFNLIDGVDGLASGIGLVAASTTLFAAFINGNTALVLATAPLVGALLAFLRYNFNPASIFLGDSGSLTIGFTLGCYGAIWGQKSTTLMGMTAPLMALAVPLLDTSLAVLRRYMRHQPIFMSDRNHVHHRLLDRGFSPRNVMFALCGVSALAAGFALLQTATHSHFGGVLVLLFGGVAWFGIRSLGYVEFTAARYMASTGMFRHLLNVHVYLTELEARLHASHNPEEFWNGVRDAGRGFGFESVQMELAGQSFEDERNSHNLERCSRVRIPLNGYGHLDLAYMQDASVQRAVAANALTDILQRTLKACDWLTHPEPVTVVMPTPKPQPDATVSMTQPPQENAL